jgi:putative ABC transport system substrate-binding protein
MSSRRDFITLLGGAAVAWPLAARAQQPTKKIRSLGLLLPGLPEASMGKATRDRLRELGYPKGATFSSKLDGRMEIWSGLMN